MDCSCWPKPKILQNCLVLVRLLSQWGRHSPLNTKRIMVRRSAGGTSKEEPSILRLMFSLGYSGKVVSSLTGHAHFDLVIFQESNPPEH